MHLHLLVPEQEWEFISASVRQPILRTSVGPTLRTTCSQTETQIQICDLNSYPLCEKKQPFFFDLFACIYCTWLEIVISSKTCMLHILIWNEKQILYISNC